MPDFTTNQWAILALVLVLGWLLGLLSASRGDRLRRDNERDREARRAEEARLRAADSRVADAEFHRRGTVGGRRNDEPF